MRKFISKGNLVNLSGATLRRAQPASSTPLPKPSLTVRRATLADRDDVTSLSRRTLGAAYVTDTLPGRYKQYMDSPSTVCSTIYQQDRLVGFLVDHITDGGLTLQRTDARLDPSVTDRDVIKQAQAQVLHDVILQQWPGVSRVRGTSTDARLEECDVGGSKTEIMTSRLLLHLTLSHSDRPPPFVENVSDATPSDLKAALETSRMASLFPNNVVLNHNIVYEASPSNADEIIRSTESTYMTRNPVGGICSLSLGSAAVCHNKLLYYTVNFNGETRLGTLNGHVLRHLRNARETAEGQNISFALSLPTRFSNVYGNERLVSELCHLIGKKHVTGSHVIMQRAFQSDLVRNKLVGIY